MGKSKTQIYCCESMKRNSKFDCNLHANEFECPDSLIYYSKKFDEYGLIIHDGGSSFVVIKFCPFCGTKLPEPKR